MPNEDQIESNKISLWNPSAAANWSLLFSPIFGAWIHSKNWTALGNNSRAKYSIFWVYGQILIFSMATFLPETLVFVIEITFFLTWYFSSAIQQVKYVKEMFSSNYEKKRWAKPLGVAIICYVGIFFVLLHLYPWIQQDRSLYDVTGVWRADEDNTMIAFKLKGKNKSIEINNQLIPVSIRDYDKRNKIITLIADNNPSRIWSIRQIFDNKDDSNLFRLTLTFQNGASYDLSFVRNF